MGHWKEYFSYKNFVNRWKDIRAEIEELKKQIKELREELSKISEELDRRIAENACW